MNLEALDQRIVDSGITKIHLAKKLGLSHQGLYNKLNGKYEFTVSEMNTLCELLRIDNADDREFIFFAPLSTDSNEKQERII